MVELYSEPIEVAARRMFPSEPLVEPIAVQEPIQPRSGRPYALQVGGSSSSLPAPHAVPAVTPATLMNVLSFSHSSTPSEAPRDLLRGRPPSQQLDFRSLLSGSDDKVSRAFEQVVGVVQELQRRAQESETMVADLQGKADELDARKRALLRQTERSERERDLALRRCQQAEEAAKEAQREAAPIVQRYMEAEVLKSQLQSTSEDILRLRSEISSCREEIAATSGPLVEAEAADEELKLAIAAAEAAHESEVAALKQEHEAQLEELRTNHAEAISALEAWRTEELSSLSDAHQEERSSLELALEGARWDSEVLRRETQEMIRETCLRQRENARLAKEIGQARQEAIDLSVKLEALRGSDEGASAREAELQAVRRRYELLQRTAAEWSEALDKKMADCKAWRHWAVKRGAASVKEAMEDEEEVQQELKALDNLQDPEEDEELERTADVPPVVADPFANEKQLHQLVTAVLSEDGTTTLQPAPEFPETSDIPDFAVSPVPAISSPNLSWSGRRSRTRKAPWSTSSSKQTTQRPRFQHYVPGKERSGIQEQPPVRVTLPLELYLDEDDDDESLLPTPQMESIGHIEAE